MNVQKLKRYAFALALSASFVVAPSLSSLSTVEAQDQQMDRRNDRNGEQQRGYRDGLNRGQEDARSHRASNPNNSSHFKSGNAIYREGFRRGYMQGYRQHRRG